MKLATVLSWIAAVTCSSQLLASVLPGGTPDDDRISVGYDASTGEVFVDAGQNELARIEILSVTGVFSGDPSPLELCDALFCNDTDFRIEKLGFGTSFGDFSFGNVAATRLSETRLLGDLTAQGELFAGGTFGPEGIDLIYIPVPEPVSGGLLAVSLTGWFAIRRAGCRSR